MRDTIAELIERKGQPIYVHQGVEVIDDPIEKNVTVTLLPPLPAKALVSDLTATEAKWKMPGIVADTAKTLYINRRYRTLIENSQKIEIRNKDKVVEYYEGWRENGKMQIRERDEHIQIYVFSKHT